MLTKREQKAYEARKQQWREYYSRDWRIRRNADSIQPFDKFCDEHDMNHESKAAQWIRVNSRHAIEVELSKY